MIFPISTIIAICTLMDGDKIKYKDNNDNYNIHDNLCIKGYEFDYL